MKKQQLKEKREDLEKQLSRLESAHTQRFHAHIASESAYRDSAKAILTVYKELCVVCEELGDPIPVRF